MDRQLLELDIYIVVVRTLSVRTITDDRQSLLWKIISFWSFQ